MGGPSWPYREASVPGTEPKPSWTGDLETPIDLSLLRRELRSVVSAGLAPGCAAVDDIEWLLLTFEELTSNALRHGLPPARVAVTITGTGWLVEVSDAAPDRPPIPAVGRDPARGGLGLHLVSRLCADHGWLIEDGAKRVWAHLVCGVGESPERVARRLHDMVTALTEGVTDRPAFRLTGTLDDVREDVVSDLFVVLQEALTNVSRHACARKVNVDVTLADDVLTVRVVDDGTGMPARPRFGGLADLRRRAHWHGGALAVEPATPGGTRLVWTVPARPKPELWASDGRDRRGIRPPSAREGSGHQPTPSPSEPPDRQLTG